MSEIWKEVPGTNGNYSASNLGRIKSNGFTVDIGRNKRYCKPRIIKLQKHSQGYLSCHVNKKVKLVHRVVAETFLTNTDNKEFVNHKNGIKTDNRPDNLEWCTRQENETHAFRTGLKNSTGSSNTMSKLNELQVYKIKYNQRGLSAKELSEIYKVHSATIRRIQRNKIWKHV